MEREALSPLQQLLAVCGQPTEPSLIPDMDSLLAGAMGVDLKQVQNGCICNRLVDDMRAVLAAC